MKKEEIHLNDIARILFGQAPPEFLIEVFFRALITYLLLLLIVKWLGKRMSGQLTIMEMAVMITLGAIVSIPMESPDRGILQGVLLLLCAVGFQRGISYLGFRSHKIENLTQGKPNTLVKDGVLLLDQLRTERISRQQLYAELRKQKLFNLGMADRVYLEACGLLSIYTASERRPGLPLYPPGDSEFDGGKSLLTEPLDEFMACTNCGKTIDREQALTCPNCKQQDFIRAVK